ncbi:PfkB family carbohydrate kinase [uncultured Mitsuokella sp.]|uniref:PfkB family carbohydrate kinase n=1 Tax=uncultured Mitsuokella sp. TaxID=453120 RepID=UPI0026DCBD4F|nr:PfkB family carbohydrate kinase [uncultured Mitsuokella sp.]
MNIKDIAELAGVSPATVSKVIHHKDSGIRDITRQNVLAVIEKYQYQPYKKILQEHERQSRIIGVATDISSTDTMRFLSALTKAFMQTGYSLMVFPYHPDYQTLLTDSIKSQHAEAVLALTKAPPLLLKPLAESGLPVFWLAGEKNPAMISLPSIKNQAAYRMTKYLLALGHHHIIGLARDGTSLWQKGYEQAFREAHQQAGKILTSEVLKNALTFWLPKECTAVLCSDLETAVLVREELRSHGLRVPQDISLACLSGVEKADKEAARITMAWMDWTAYAAKISRNLLEQLGVRAEDAPADDEQMIQILPCGSTAAPPQKGLGRKLIVVGSINMDRNIFLPHLPAAGENLMASKVVQAPGGKGANQAVGAARLGAETCLIGMMGKDAASQMIFNELQKNHVCCTGVSFDAALDTGTAYINVTAKGESSIVIYPGANSLLTRERIAAQETLFDGAHYCLLSTEIPMSAIEETLQICRRKGIPVLVKPANIRSLPAALLPAITYLLPSRREIEMLRPGPSSLEEKAQYFLQAGVKHVIITLGADGCLFCHQGGHQYFPAMDIQPVDTTGGADAFISALAVYLSEGMPIETAIGFGTYSAGLCIAGPGVQPSLPQRNLLESYREEIQIRFMEKGGIHHA